MGDEIIKYICDLTCSLYKTQPQALRLIADHHEWFANTGNPSKIIFESGDKDLITNSRTASWWVEPEN